MIEQLSAYTAAAIKRAVPDHPASEAVLKYALEGIFNALFIITLSLIISAITGRVGEAATLLAAFAGLRQITGGIHLKSGTLCVLVSTANVTLLSFVSLSTPLFFFGQTASLILILLFAPSRIERQSRFPKSWYPLLKVMGAVLVLANFWIHSSMITAAFFVQSLTLIRRPFSLNRRGGESL
ncbi:accessory gene regulator ArgB-like protein [Paenibacillus stellifer]|uniref:accessory gene regulator ArgB-like protein n=1 Tax=Paenibacillus stellifer TaxID=169760 RepID=UPI00068ED953|nr:accessory gene regulator B family protein [Paenibacillus stellifer]